MRESGLGVNAILEIQTLQAEDGRTPNRLCWGQGPCVKWPSMQLSARKM